LDYTEEELTFNLVTNQLINKLQKR
jgi:hypothetical protein